MTNIVYYLFLVFDFIDRKIIPGFKIEPNERVIDIGSGDKPFWRGDVFLDNLKLDNRQRISGNNTIHNLGTFVNEDIAKTSFKDSEFDFSFCSHLLEHVQRPDLVIREIMRISKRGYIEVPNGILETIKPFHSHLWFVYYANGTLTFVRKSKNEHKMLQENGKQYQYLFKHIKNPFIRIYWKKSIKFKIVENQKASQNFIIENNNSEPITKKRFNPYMLIVIVLRFLFYSEKKLQTSLLHNLRNSIARILLFISPVLLVSLFVFWSSFKLDLTGDDFLGLWRYHYYLDGYRGGHWNTINFFLTDYGPQDTITAIIHNFVGFQSKYYYITSFIFRILAAFSFYPVVKYLTKNSTAAYLATIFFSITTTGLETTDWSFNMPSYLAIALLNVLLLAFFKLKEKPTLKLLALTGALFCLAIISQPIRMTFLPGFMILLEVFTLVNKRTKKTIKWGIVRICMYLAIALLIYVMGFIGNSVGAGETLAIRLNGGWSKVIGGSFLSLIPSLQRGEFSTLAYPFAQLGNIILPSSIIPPGYQTLTVAKAIFKLLIPIYLFFAFLVLLYKKKKTSPLLTIATNALLAFWGIYVLIFFVILSQYPFNKSQFISIVIGGFSVILCIYLFIQARKNQNFIFGVFLSIVLTFISFTTFWLRSPTFLYESTSRYLILPAAGLTILLGVLLGYSKTKKEKWAILLIFIPMLLINLSSSHTFLSHLSTVREYTQTEKIRHSIPYVTNFNNPDIPLVFYFEPKDSEVLHHALLFGFPVIMGAQYSFFNVWHYAYTDNWQEVLEAYSSGSSLKRFSIPIKKVELTNVYSFRLENDHIVNTTNETRRKLLDLQKKVSE